MCVRTLELRQSRTHAVSLLLAAAGLNGLNEGLVDRLRAHPTNLSLGAFVQTHADENHHTVHTYIQL